MFHIRIMLNAIFGQFQILVKSKDGKTPPGSHDSQIKVKLAKLSDMINQYECVSQCNHA